MSEESKRKGRPHEFEPPRPLTNRNNRGRSAKAEGMAMAKARYHRIAESARRMLCYEEPWMLGRSQSRGAMLEDRSQSGGAMLG